MSNPQLEQGRINLSESEYNVWFAVVEQGIEKEHILHRSFFSNKSNQLRPYDRINVVNDEGTFYMELLVLTVGRGWAKTFELSSHSLVNKDVDQTQADMYDNQGLVIGFKGPHHRFCVYHEKTGDKIKTKCQTREEAETWLRHHLETT